MLACTACGRAWNSRALDARSLSTATCPGCGGELESRRFTQRAPSAREPARFTTAKSRLHIGGDRVSGLGG